MKKFVDFEKSGPLSKVIDQVIGIESAVSPEEADLIITDSESKAIGYLQMTEKKVVQICFEHCQPMTHLIEDCPDRFRVADIRTTVSVLAPIIVAIGELVDK